MSRIIFLAVLHFLYLPIAFGQQGSYECGAVGYAMADASVARGNEWSAFHNVAGISKVAQATVAFTYMHRHHLRALHSMAAAAIVPIGHSSRICAGIFRFGDRMLNEQKISLGFANKIGFVRLGAQVHYAQLNVETVGREGILLVDLGGIVEFSPKIAFGAHIFNAGVARYSKFQGSTFPVVLSSGFCYRPIDEAALCLEVEHITGLPLNTRIGFEYLFYDRFPVRAGFMLRPSTFFFGAGFRSGRVSVDYAFSHHQLLGYTHQGTCALQITR